MTYLVVDDDKSCQDTIVELLKLMDVVTICVGRAPDVPTAIELYTRHKPEVIFLDIELGDNTGFDFLDSLDSIDSHIIFTTAHEEFGVPAIKHGAIDYLIKPVGMDEMRIAVEKVMNRTYSSAPIITKDGYRAFNEQYNMLASLEERLALPLADSMIFIKKGDIEYLKADGSYCFIHMKNGTRHYISKPLGFMEKKISNPAFIRVHGSFVINRFCVLKYYRGDGGSILMNSGAELSVSRQGKMKLSEALNL